MEQRIGATLALCVVALAAGVVLSVEDTVDLLDALSAFVWPMVVVWLLYRLLPSIVDVVRSRAFDVEVGGVRISVQEALDQLPRQLDDLRAHVVRERANGAPGAAEIHESSPTPAAGGDAGRVLWVDDRPRANVFERETLIAEGWRIEQASSTEEALDVAAGNWTRFSVVISDMGRQEPAGYAADAGIDLVRRIRAEGAQLPIFIYTSRPGLERRPEALAAGATGLTSSPTELLASVRAVVAPLA